jgi:hypothetical protein
MLSGEEIMIRKRFCFNLALLLAIVSLGSSQDLYIKDTPLDTGVEPNPDNGAMWVSDDIWVRTAPDPGYKPYPFIETSPPWTPLPHENPEYRDPKYSVPNYVYVRVRNRGSAPSGGTERLRVYWAKASTGLSWPTQWVDYLANNCGPMKLFGAEITKPRQNAATASQAERNAYRDAILAIGTNPAYVFSGVSYWHKQQEVHTGGPPNRHHTPAFLAWHREMVNRYEVLLQEFNPTVKLLYWDWTTDPRNSTGGFNFFDPTILFMGNSGAGTGGVSMGPPFAPSSGPTLVPPAVTRDLGGDSNAPTPTTISDSTVLGNTTFPTFRPGIETFPNPHDYSHVYLGGGGTMSFVPVAAEDPFFFLLHGNVDRLWAQWQRNPSSLSRLDPATTYGTQTTNANITTIMQPWDGTGTVIQPWTTAGGYIISKAPTDPSVVSPPIYDTAPLTVPVLQPGEAVVIQIPWYPPDPAAFSCFGGDQGHFCLLARIETSSTTPFGMTTPETNDVYANTKNNNNIAWKNVTIVDNFPGPQRLSSIIIRNIFKERIQVGLRFADTGRFGASFFDKGRMFLDLKPELAKRWRDGRASARGIKVADDRQAGRLEIVAPDAAIQNITLEPNEAFSVDLNFELAKNVQAQRGAEFDLIQTGAPGNPEAIVGGQRFKLDFSKMVLVKSGEQWRYQDNGSDAPKGWTSSEFDDSKWKLGKAALGFGDKTTTTVDAGPPGRRHITAYFRRTFEVSDPSFYQTAVLRLKRDDGGVVYLNGKEIHRVNLPPGPVDARTVATRDVAGLEKDVFFPVKMDPESLVRGKNTVAVEVHLHSVRSEDLRFDLELSANRADPGFPPDIAFAEPPDGSLFQPGETVPIKVEALDSDGKIKSVSLYADGKLAGTAQQPPYTFKWPAKSNGPHRLRAVAVDNDNKQSQSFLTVSVVENVPPAVTLTQPANGTMVKRGAAIPLSAQASDRGGKVTRVEFYVREHGSVMAPDTLVATAKNQPSSASIKNLKPGHYMVWAVAIDDRGESSQSLPVHIGVE